MKKIFIKILYIILIIITFDNITVYSLTANELEDAKRNINSKIDETTSEIAGVKSKMTTALQQIIVLNEEISNYEKEIKTLELQISNLNIQINSKENQIIEKEVQYKKSEQILEKRLIALYESGRTTYLDMLLSSKNLSDFISKYYLISELAMCDNTLLENIQLEKKDIEDEKAILENQKIELENSKTAIARKQSSLNSTINEKNNIVNNLSLNEQKLNEQLEEFENDKKEIQMQLEKISKEENRTQYLTTNSYNYIFPVQNSSKSNINNLNYPSYKGHTGIDININVIGKNVVAVENGTVVISEAKKNSDGSYRSYGEYIVINHHNGTMTLYAHLLSNSRKVFKGDTVSKGQIIGIVGNTGNSTGTHLHFEVRINGLPVNPTSYLP